MGLLPRSFYLDDLFDDFDRHPAPRHHEMKCDISEDKDNYLIEMDIPGYNKEDIKIECENGLLTVSAEKKQEVNENDPLTPIEYCRQYPQKMNLISNTIEVWYVPRKMSNMEKGD